MNGTNLTKLQQAVGDGSTMTDRDPRLPSESLAHRVDFSWCYSGGSTNECIERTVGVCSRGTHCEALGSLRWILFFCRRM